MLALRHTLLTRTVRSLLTLHSGKSKPDKINSLFCFNSVSLFVMAHSVDRGLRTKAYLEIFDTLVSFLSPDSSDILYILH